MQWGSKVKGSSVLQNISKGMSNLQKGCVTLFYSQGGKDKLSLQEMNKGTLVYSQAEGQGPPRQALEYDYNHTKASQRNSFQHGVRIDFLPATGAQETRRHVESQGPGGQEVWLSIDLSYSR